MFAETYSYDIVGKQEGIQEGRKEGKLEIAQASLANRLDVKTIATITRLAC